MDDRRWKTIHQISSADCQVNKAKKCSMKCKKYINATLTMFFSSRFVGHQPCKHPVEHNMWYMALHLCQSKLILNNQDKVFVAIYRDLWCQQRSAPLYHAQHFVHYQYSLWTILNATLKCLCIYYLLQLGVILLLDHI